MNAPVVGGQLWHDLMPAPNHDALARQLFTQSLQKIAYTELMAGEAHAWERRVRPMLIDADGVEEGDARAARLAMDRDPYARMFGALRRASKDMEFEACAAMIEPELPDLIAKARDYRDRADKIGSLKLDADLKVPAYNANTHIHGMPGGYHSELTEDDVFAGAVFERAFYIGQWGGRGPLCDDMGLSLANWIRAELPGDFVVRDLLDMGCTNGQSTLPLVDAFPDARIHAIDLAAPCLRYGHARAEHLGKAVHFSQQNAEQTSFADGSFDVIVSMILLHETSAPAVRNIFAECHRLLRPGGYMLHVDSGHPANFPKGVNFPRLMALWGERYNYEPFISRVSEMDWHEAAAEAGFARDAMRDSPLRSTVDDAPTQRYVFAVRK